MKLKLTTLALGTALMASAFTTTGCDEDVLGTDSLDTNNTVDATELSAPASVSIVVTSETAAEVRFTAANATESSDGYVLLNGTKILQSLTLPAFTGDTAFTVAINKDSAMTYGVATVEGSEQSTAKTATFMAREMYGPYSIMKIVSKVAGTGVDVDAVDTVAVAAGAASTGYIDGGAADFFFENTTTGAVTITPLNGGKVVALTAGAMISESDLASVKSLVISTELTTSTLTSGVVVYSNGKSPKDTAGATLAIAAGMEFLVVSSTANPSVTRVMIDSVDAAGVVAMTVYKAAANDGVTLYKSLK